MSHANPYAPPQAPLEPPRGPGALAQGACPRCNGADVNRPTFTWWGGMLGPKLLSHAVCRGCGYGFNWKTGKSNTTGIAIYTGVGIVLGIVVFAMLSMR